MGSEGEVRCHGMCRAQPWPTMQKMVQTRANVTLLPNQGWAETCLTGMMDKCLTSASHLRFASAVAPALTSSIPRPLTIPTFVHPTKDFTFPYLQQSLSSGQMHGGGLSIYEGWAAGSSLQECSYTIPHRVFQVDLQ